jgi:hypothetical protein
MRFCFFSFSVLNPSLCSYSDAHNAGPAQCSLKATDIVIQVWRESYSTVLVLLKKCVFCYVTSCGLPEFNRYFGKNVPTPSSGLMRKPRKLRAENRALHAAKFLLITCLTYCLTLKMEAVWSSETSVILYWNTRRHISGDGTLHSHHREDLKFNAIFLWAKSFPLQWLHRNSKHNELTP